MVFTHSFIHAQIFWGSFSSTISKVDADGTNLNESFIGGLAQAQEPIVYNNQLYWVHGSSIGRADLDGSNANNTFITGLNGPGGIAIFNDKIYWTSFYDNKIGRADIDGTNVNQSFVANSGNAPTGIAIDETNGVIYWITYNDHTIGRVDLDGVSNLNASLITGLGGQGVQIVVDEANSKILWTVRGSAIGRANLDGTGLNTNFITGLSQNQALTIDATDGKLYFNSGNNIGVADLDGSNVNLALVTGLSGLPWQMGFNYVPPPSPEVPTLSQWGLLILALLFMSLGTLYLLQPKLQEQEV